MKPPQRPIDRRMFFRELAKIVAFSIGCVMPASVLAATVSRINGMRLADRRDKTRLVIDLNHSVEHTLFTLSNPERIVIDVRNTSFTGTLPILSLDGPIKKIRSARRNANDVRVVLELNHRVRSKSFLLPPDGSTGHRLVVDLFDNRVYAGDEPVTKPKTTTAGKNKPLRDVVVAIDAGHGGKDPGASGKGRTREKDITLAVAKRLRDMLEKEHGIKPVMIRNKDVFISLRERIRIARKNKADLFISIHADAFRDVRARGASVYTLSNRGATSEAAQWLADKENAADLFGGVSIRNRTDIVAEVLLDLAQSATIQSSLDVGSVVLKNLGKVGRVHKRRVEQAGFAVLKSPDIPSILVETAFISNPSEEKKLRSKSYQIKLAAAITKGVKQYFSRHAPPGTILSGRSEINVG
ncbi:MAG: N-acetylmuramoyl-L-alanine amidase [Pseudomonadota bacterium]